MSLLVANESASFPYLVEKTEATRGNVSVQISKLEEAGYITVEKTFKDKKPHTLCRVTKKGLAEMDEYTQSLKDYLDL